MSAAWNDISADTIRNCFFHSLTSAVSDKPFLGFSFNEVPPLFTQETYTQCVNFDNALEVTGFKMMPIYIKKFYKTSKLKKMTSMRRNFGFKEIQEEI